MIDKKDTRETTEERLAETQVGMWKLAAIVTRSPTKPTYSAEITKTRLRFQLETRELNVEPIWLDGDDATALLLMVRGSA